METHWLVPTHDRTDLLEQFLRSCKPDDFLQVNTLWIIENGSQVAEEVVEKYAGKLPLKYHHLPEGNKSRALNSVVLKLPDDALLVFVDDDITMEPGMINIYKAAAAKYGSNHYFGGPVHPDYAFPPSPEIQAYLPPSCRDFDLSQGEQYRTFPAYRLFLGANWACFASDLKRVGGFNPDYGPGGKNNMRGQEADAQQRLAAAGATPVFLRDARVHHHVSEKMVTRPWVIERIFRSLYHKGKEQPTLWHALGLTAKLIYSLLLLPLQPGNIGHLYRINKAAGYFYGLTSHYLKGKE